MYVHTHARCTAVQCEYADCDARYRLAEMTLSDETRHLVDQWVADHPRQPCTGAARQALLEHLKIHLPEKTPQQKKRNGETPLNQPVMLRGDKKLREKKQHFTATQCIEELGMKCVQCVQVFFSELCFNACAMEDALQTSLQCYRLGTRLWREVAKDQKDRDKPPEEDVAYKVFITYSFDVQAAIKKGVWDVTH
jgi:hypothetical protein